MTHRCNFEFVKKKTQVGSSILIFFLLFISLSAWAMSSAVGSSPDEDRVLMSTWCGIHNFTTDFTLRRKYRETETFDGKFMPATKYCTNDPENVKHFLVPTLVAQPQLCFLEKGKNESAKCQSVLINDTTSMFFENAENTIYIKTLRTLVGSKVEVSVVKMRILNSLIATIVIFLTFTALKFNKFDIFISVLGLLQPFGFYLLSSINTSSWTITGTTCFTLALISAIRSPTSFIASLQTVVLATISIWLTFVSRIEGKYFLLILILGILASKVTPKIVEARRAVAVIVAFLALLFVFDIFYGQSGRRTNLFDDQRVEVSEGITTTANNLLVNNIIALPRFITGFFGSWGLGWFEVELTSATWLFSLQAFLLIIFFSLKKSTNYHRLIFGMLFTVLCTAILYANQQRFAKVGEYIQPRYFLPFFLGIVIIAAANKTERYPNSLVITVAILATISNSIALRDTIRRYTTGQDVFISKSLNNPIEWWWQFGPQPETVWLTGTLAFAALWAILIYDRNKEEVDAPILPAPESAN
jgi:hypothetical protein